MFYDIYLDLCKQKKVSPTRAALEMGLSKATPTTWKKRGLTPQGETLNKIAAYFNVSADYLLGTGSKSSEKTETPPVLTKKDERDISRRIDQILTDLESQQAGLMFDGEPLDEETKELLAISLRNSMETSKIWAKKKFTPKKYRKDE